MGTNDFMYKRDNKVEESENHGIEELIQKVISMGHLNTQNLLQRFMSYQNPE